MWQVRPWSHHFLYLEHRTHAQYISPASFLMQHAIWLCRAKVFFGVLLVIPKYVRTSFNSLQAIAIGVIKAAYNRFWVSGVSFGHAYMYCQDVLSANGLHAWSTHACCPWVLPLIISFLHHCISLFFHNFR